MYFGVILFLEMHILTWTGGNSFFAAVMLCWVNVCLDTTVFIILNFWPDGLLWVTKMPLYMLCLPGFPHTYTLPFGVN